VAKVIATFWFLLFHLCDLGPVAFTDCSKLKVFLRHGLYCSTNCCISHGSSQWEMAIFEPHSSETLESIFMKLEIYNCLTETTPHEKFQGLSTWVVWANSQFDAWKFLSVFPFLRHSHGSHLWAHSHALYVNIRRTGQGSAFWESERWKLKFNPF